MRTDKKNLSAVPNPDDIIPHRFVTASTKKMKRSVTDEKGKVIREETIEIPVRVPIPNDELANVGIDCSLFDIDNVVKAGQPLTKVTTPLYGRSLDTVSSTMDYLDNFDTNNLINKVETNEN